MSEIVERLRDYANDDHERLCRGREYTCSCGYDDKRDPLLTEAADEIDRLNAALRQARIEALEEAALIAEGQAESDRWASVDFEVDATFSCEQVAERIRALKDKQP